MYFHKFHKLGFLLFLSTFFLAGISSAPAQTFTVLYTFSGSGGDGSHPLAGVILDSSGNVYGTTRDGGIGNGTVFKLTPGNGTWTETILYNFGSVKNDGLNPTGALIFDKKGNLYGTTQNGGAYGAGTAFRLELNKGAWKETIIHSFGLGTDGATPVNGLTYDGNVTAYGTTYYGGTNQSCTYLGATTSCGTAFQISQTAGGGVSYAVIHNFGSGSSDGFLPWSSLAIGPTGSLFGQCVTGGEYLKGLLYELIPGTGGAFTEKVIHPWGNKDDGTYIYGGLAFDTSGNMYGVSTGGGGHGGLGTVFEFTPSGSGYLEQNLHGFGTGLDGQFPVSNLLVNASANLFGVTHNGGTYGYGMIYKVAEVSGSWGETILHNFTGGADGAASSATLVSDSSGNLYGTATYGGNSSACGGPVPGCGVVFTITP